MKPVVNKLRPRRKVKATADTPAVQNHYEITHSDLTWIYINQPQEKDYRWLEENFDFHPLALEDVRSKTQRPKVDEHADYLFTVMHFPVYDQAKRRLSYGELDMFVGEHYVIMITDVKLNALEAFYMTALEKHAERVKLMSRGTGHLLYNIVDLLFDRCFPMLSKIGAKLDAIGLDIFEDRHQETVKETLNLKQEVITFRRIMRPQTVVIRDLEKAKDKFGGHASLEYYLDDVEDAARRIWELLEGYKEVLTAYQETSESLISGQLNENLKVLTAFSVIILPLTLVASLYGMNVHLPFAKDPGIFYFILAGLGIIFLTMFTVFKKKRLL